MAIKVIGKIVLYEALTQDKIDDLIASSDVIALQIEQNISSQYSGNDSLILDTDLTGFTVDYMQSLKDIIDRSSFKFFENAIFFNVVYSDSLKSFDLSTSYVRTDVDSTSVQGSVTSGQLLQAYFITPGMDGNVYTVIDLPYGQSISSADEAKMLNIGLELNLGGTGSSFSIKTQKVPFKVMFVKPDVVIEKYVINFDKTNQTIEI